MNLFGKPLNKWGWVRTAGCAALIGVAAWTLLSAVPAVPVGNLRLSFVDGLELAVLPLLLLLFGAWMEEQDQRLHTEQAENRVAEKAAAEQRKQILTRVERSLQGNLPAADGADPAMKAKLAALILAASADLDGKGKGELLLWLYDRRLISGEQPAIHLAGVDFCGTDLHKAHLAAVRLEGVDLASARLDGAHLEKADLRDANLQKASLRYADLKQAVLAAGNLSGAQLTGAHLHGADLSETCLNGAILLNADLSGCQLTGAAARDANFQGANLTGAHLCEDDLLEQAVLIETIFPDGRKVTNARGKEYLHKKEIAQLIDRL